MQAFFIDAPEGGLRFCIHHPAQGPLKRGQILYLHPFAEEMNKSRRMAALMACAMSRAGFEVLQIDLLGCGDSSGDFGDATWQAWIEDALLACRWLQRQPEPAPLWLWGLRAGCLLANAVQARVGAPTRLLWVQPSPSGKPLLQQFLRLRLAGEILDGTNKGLMAQLRSALVRGETVEVAGYALHAELGLGLDGAQLLPAAGTNSACHVAWLDLRTSQAAEWSPVAQHLQQQWRAAGCTVTAEMVQGPAFWQTIEVEEAPGLIDAACRLLIEATEGQMPCADALQRLPA